MLHSELALPKRLGMIFSTDFIGRQTMIWSYFMLWRND